ncbi:putative lipoprotein [Leptospira inadai serovar Lyme str. 10]|uniref:Lipoprotein n=2 Tax=Leptospira inadai serovar Lyme TaxID=293084 RepID=A0ABX4YE38_9LEPT|nr:hypothetical protein [Leptospira inadai]EQA35116.1 putative lipoprotein [Leptospira inadai serovar Lyme str. 10]PNV72460.1 hypothetical protein BES34_019375 [Leptospira inadai serovar Lyme]
MKIKLTLLAVGISSCLIGIASIFAQPRETAAQCSTLKEEHKMRECIACMERPVKHIYHPHLPDGERCKRL